MITNKVQIHQSPKYNLDIRMWLCKRFQVVFARNWQRMSPFCDKKRLYVRSWIRFFEVTWISPCRLTSHSEYAWFLKLWVNLRRESHLRLGNRSAWSAKSLHLISSILHPANPMYSTLRQSCFRNSSILMTIS